MRWLNGPRCDIFKASKHKLSRLMNHTKSLHKSKKQLPITFGFIWLVLSLWPMAAQAKSEQDLFWENLSALCGQAFSGQLTVYDDVSDAGWIGQRMTIHGRECSPIEIRISLNVGDDRSRTWVFQRAGETLVLKHDHRHEDGSEDILTWYGGKTVDEGRATRQAFKVDGYSQSLFYAQGLDVSAGNIWYVEIQPGQTFSYGLTRPNRHFRAEFDLTQTIDTPPAPWGATVP